MPRKKNKKKKKESSKSLYLALFITSVFVLLFVVLYSANYNTNADNRSNASYDFEIAANKYRGQLLSFSAEQIDESQRQYFVRDEIINRRVFNTRSWDNWSPISLLSKYAGDKSVDMNSFHSYTRSNGDRKQNFVVTRGNNQSHLLQRSYDAVEKSWDSEWKTAPEMNSIPGGENGRFSFSEFEYYESGAEVDRKNSVTRKQYLVKDGRLYVRSKSGVYPDINNASYSDWSSDPLTPAQLGIGGSGELTDFSAVYQTSTERGVRPKYYQTQYAVRGGRLYSRSKNPTWSSWEDVTDTMFIE